MPIGYERAAKAQGAALTFRLIGWVQNHQREFQNMTSIKIPDIKNPGRAGVLGQLCSLIIATRKCSKKVQQANKYVVDIQVQGHCSSDVVCFAAIYDAAGVKED